MHNYNIVMIIKITVQYPCKSLDRKSENHWTVLTGMYPANLHTQKVLIC